MVRVVRTDRPATMADLEALPPSVKGEIVEGVLYTFARPRPSQMNTAGVIYGDLFNPFQFGQGGPGGWWILIEPGIDLPRSPEVSPDVAGWRRERLPALPANASISVVPDWLCEVLSPSTRSYVLRVKRPFYARVGVSYMWIVDLEARLLTASKLVDGHWWSWRCTATPTRFASSPSPTSSSTSPGGGRRAPDRRLRPAPVEACGNG